MVLVPATMELLGDASWWMPKWLDRILPEVHIEGDSTVQAELDELLSEEAAKDVTPPAPGSRMGSRDQRPLPALWQVHPDVS